MLSLGCVRDEKTSDNEPADQPIKIRLQCQNPKKPLYNGAVDCFKQVVKQESVLGLYKGWKEEYQI